MILLIDNYDSFTFNLYQYFGELGEDVSVYRNDALRPEDVGALQPEVIVLSPGPGAPEGAGITLEVIRRYAGVIPILGICLGHQAIGQALGARVIRNAPVHGKTSPVFHDGRTIFSGLPSPFSACRYHSLVVDPSSLPPCLEVSARTPSGEIMGLRHRDYPLEGVQFHPEAILTEHGRRLLQNFLGFCRRPGPCRPPGSCRSVPGQGSEAGCGVVGHHA